MSSDKVFAKTGAFLSLYGTTFSLIVFLLSAAQATTHGVLLKFLGLSCLTLLFFGFCSYALDHGVYGMPALITFVAAYELLFQDQSVFAVAVLCALIAVALGAGFGLMTDAAAAPLPIKLATVGLLFLWPAILSRLHLRVLRSLTQGA